MSADTAPKEETPPEANDAKDQKPNGNAPEEGEEKNDDKGEENKDDKGEEKKSRPKWLLPVVGIVVVAGLIYFYRSYTFGLTHASTDDAQVASRLASVAPSVGGTITKVYVDDNEMVKKGALLVEIDPENYTTSLDQAKANLALAEAQEREAEVNIGLTTQTGNAQITQAQGGVDQNQGSVDAAQAEVVRSRAAVATVRSQASSAEANARGAQAAYQIAVVNVARAKDAVREAQAAAINARAGVKSAQAAVVSAQASEENARKDNARFQQLFKEGAVSAQTADTTLSAYRVATAQREAAQENVRAAQATARQREAAIGTARGSVAASRAQVVQANTAVQAAKVTAQGANDAVDQAQAAVGTAQANVASARGKVQQAQGVLQQANTADTQVVVRQVALQQAKARVKQARAALANAQINFGDTKIYAPIDGKVSRRTATVGQQATANTPLMQIVPVSDIWVQANFKETQLKDMKIGQPVEIEVDALDGDPLKGRVDSFSPNTGAAVALLPPDNATGNFTKVVQRVPIKITFEPGQPKVKRLAVGMSVVATVDTAEKR